MLRVSAQTNETEIDLQGINGDADSAARGIAHGAELMAFAEAVARRDPDDIHHARARLASVAGQHAVVDAAGVAANFQRMVRIADAIGIPVDDMDNPLGQGVRAELDLERFPSAANTTGRSV